MLSGARGPLPRPFRTNSTLCYLPALAALFLLSEGGLSAPGEAPLIPRPVTDAGFFLSAPPRSPPGSPSGPRSRARPFRDGRRHPLFPHGSPLSGTAGRSCAETRLPGWHQGLTGSGWPPEPVTLSAAAGPVGILLPLRPGRGSVPSLPLAGSLSVAPPSRSAGRYLPMSGRNNPKNDRKSLR